MHPTEGPPPHSHSYFLIVGEVVLLCCFFFQLLLRIEMQNMFLSLFKQSYDDFFSVFANK